MWFVKTSSVGWFSGSQTELAKIESKCAPVISSVAYRRSSQYAVSRPSLYEIEILHEKSGLEIALCSSTTLAPDVPHRNSCLERMDSFRRWLRCLWRRTFRTANREDLSRFGFCIHAASDCSGRCAWLAADCSFLQVSLPI